MFIICYVYVYDVPHHDAYICLTMKCSLDQKHYLLNT